MKKIIIGLFIFVVAVLLILFSIHWYFTKDIRVISEADRQNSSWSFAKIQSGITHYEIVGNDTSVLIVLLAGCGNGGFIFDSNIVNLKNAGFRVLRYDYYGRGLSDHPEDVIYTHKYYNTQLLELLNYLNIKKPFHLVGVSMGGSVAIDFADRYHHLVKSLTLIGPAALGNKPSALLKIPLLNTFMMNVYWASKTEDQQLSEFKNPATFEKAYRQKIKDEASIRNFTYAVQSSWSNILNKRMTSELENIAKRKTPVLLLWGDSDPVVPLTLSRFYLKADPTIKFQIIKNAGHIANYENHEMTDSLIRNFTRTVNTH